jgi:hypothetical protein
MYCNRQVCAGHDGGEEPAGILFNVWAREGLGEAVREMRENKWKMDEGGDGEVTE